MRNDPNKVLRTSVDATVNARDYTMVLADATDGPIALTLITPGVYSEWSIKVKNTGSGSDVSLSVAGGGSFSFDLPAGAGCEITQDDLGALHVFGSTSGSSGGGPIPAGSSITYSATPYDSDGSFQPIGPDLNLAAAAGTDDPDTAYLAPIMGNVIGDDLTKDANTVAGLIGKLSVTGTRASTYPVAAVVAEVGDGVTEADGAVVAVLGGDSGVTTARAAFTVDNQNSTPGSGLEYGVDLRGVEHNGYGPLSYSEGDIRLASGVVFSSAVVELSDAQIKALTNTPVEIIPNPGAGRLVLPTFTCITTSGFGANPYTGMDADGYLTLMVSGPADIQDIVVNDSGIPLIDFSQLMALADGLAVVNAPLNQSFVSGWGIISGARTWPTYANKAINISINNNGNVANLGGGNAANTMKVTVLYIIVEV